MGSRALHPILDLMQFTTRAQRILETSQPTLRLTFFAWQMLGECSVVRAVLRLCTIDE